MNDRNQKAMALKYAVSKHWFPQLEVDVQPPKAVTKSTPPVTDLDVVACLPDDFRGLRVVVFDCKTKAKESPVNRALWLRGVLDRLAADQGFCLLKKDVIEFDHCMLALRLNVILLTEDEFELYAKATSRDFDKPVGHSASIEAWDRFFDIPDKFPKLEQALWFARSGHWMIDDAAEACRKTLAGLCEIRPELDPTKPEHVALALDYAALFARSLAIMVCNVFRAYLHPGDEAVLEDALKMQLYGGRDAYEHRNQLYRLIQDQKGQHAPPADLSLPAWDRFLQLFRQLLDAPIEVSRAPLILREVGFGALRGSTDFDFAKRLCAATPQGARFSVLIVDYLCKAAKLPPEFQTNCEKVLLAIQPGS